MLGLAGGQVVDRAAVAGEAYRRHVGGGLRRRLLQIQLEALVADRDRRQVEHGDQGQRAVGVGDQQRH